MEWLLQLTLLSFLFILGTIMGSFLNVVVYRTIEGKESWKRGRSRCDHCKKTIEWYDNIPLLSYILLQGKCRHCHKEIAFSHVVMELLMGVLFVWWYGVGFLFFRLTHQPLDIMQPLFWLSVGVLFVMILAADLRYFIIPDFTVVALTVLTVLYRGTLLLTGVMQSRDFGLTLFALVAFTGIFFGLWWFTKGRGMGFGDVKLMIPLTLLLGWPKILVAIFISFVSGALIGLVLMALHKKTLKQPIPFGPFLIFGAVVSLLCGDFLWHSYVNMLR